MSFDITALAATAKLSAQEFESFVEQAGVTRDDRYKRTPEQMDRLREQVQDKWALAHFMEHLVQRQEERAGAA